MKKTSKPKRLTLQQQRIREWKKRLREISWSEVINGLFDDSISDLAYSEGTEEAEQKFQMHYDSLREMCLLPEIPKELGEKLRKELFNLESEHGYAMVSATEAIFSVAVKYLLPRVPYPFAGLGLFPEAKRK